MPTLNNALTAAYLISQQTGIAPNVLMGQFMAENGQNLSGTGAQQNNFANLMPGGSLASYSSPQAFANAYVSTIQHNFPSAIGTGTNATAFGDALANGTGGLQFQQGITPQQYTNNINMLSQTPNAIAPNNPYAIAPNTQHAITQALTSSLSSGPTPAPNSISAYLSKEGANIAFITFGIVLVIFCT